MLPTNVTHNEILRVSAKHVAIFSYIKYKEHMA
jgi:hypothetical protein